jgi:Flp pilus assembly protein TadG
MNPEMVKMCNQNQPSGRILGNQQGSTILMVLFALVALFAFCVLAIDGPILLTTKTQLQNAADAAALAGATGLIEGDNQLATDRAIAFASYNQAVQSGRAPVVIDAQDVDFPASNMVRVTTHRTRATNDALRTYFMRVIDPTSDNLADVTASAAAQAYDVCGSRCLRPWAIPDRWADADGDGEYDDGEFYDPDSTGYTAPLDVGASIVLKVGNPQQSIAPGQFYPVNYPPLDHPDQNPLTGGDWYREWMVECEPFSIGPGDRLQLEPGNMVGPTSQGVGDIIAADPGARWDAGSQTIVNSDFGMSPRVILVPFFDPTQPPESGRNWVTVTKIGAFFLEGVSNGGSVMARFIQVTVPGTPCDGEASLGNSFVKGIVLVE